MTDDEPLRHELEALRGQVAQLRQQVGALEGVRGQRVFVARHDGAGGDWQELVPTGDGTTLGDFVGGRHSTTNDILVDLAAAAAVENVCAVLQTRTAAGRLAFLQLTGGTPLTAQYDGMVFQAGADLTVSAGYFRLTNGPAA